MSLPVLWFVVVAFFWTGFFVLEGFDFGVGALHRVVGRDDTERRVAINAIGPTWDGNEVWLIVAGAAMFAAFPDWYATWFSALYLALVLILVALIVRGVSFEFRGKAPATAWRRTWSTTLTAGSVAAPLLIGVGLGDLLAGLPVDAQHEFTGTFWDLLTPYGVVFGVTVLALCLLHGATFLALKTGPPVSGRSTSVARRLSWPGAVLVILTSAWTWRLSEGTPLSIALLALAVLGSVGGAWALASGRAVAAFAATAATVGATVASIFAGLYPDVLVSSTSSANSLTVTGAASGDYALTVITVVAVVLVPVVLLYQGWSYHVFRQRVLVPRTEDEVAASS
jgi:cytochrome d ubiquinol oxidase subunit II